MLGAQRSHSSAEFNYVVFTFHKGSAILMYNVSARDHVALLHNFQTSVVALQYLSYIVGVHTSFMLNILALQSVNGNLESPFCLILNVGNVPNVTISDQAVTLA